MLRNSIEETEKVAQALEQAAKQPKIMDLLENGDNPDTVCH